LPGYFWGSYGLPLSLDDPFYLSGLIALLARSFSDLVLQTMFREDLWVDSFGTNGLIVTAMGFSTFFGRITLPCSMSSPQATETATISFEDILLVSMSRNCSHEAE
jgi:hypothetical protein